MFEDEVKININTKRCYIIIAISLGIELLIVGIYVFLVNHPKIYYQLQNKFVASGLDKNNLFVWTLGITFMIIIPATIIFQISEVHSKRRILKHIYFLKRINPEVDFSHLSRKDINMFVGQLDRLLNLKTNFLGIGTWYGIVNMLNTAVSNKIYKMQYFEEHLYELQELYPSFNFAHLSKKEKAIIEDELDAMIYFETYGN